MGEKGVEMWNARPAPTTTRFSGNTPNKYAKNLPLNPYEASERLYRSRWQSEVAQASRHPLHPTHPNLSGTPTPPLTTQREEKGSIYHICAPPPNKYPFFLPTEAREGEGWEGGGGRGGTGPFAE